MSLPPLAFLRRLAPSIVRTSLGERVRASFGALVGILLTGFASKFALGGEVNLPLLIAPMGASAVLLFAAPSSPLAQPWSILGGNLVSALMGVTCAVLIDDPLLAASLAISLSIAVMLMLNCLHPPSGAVALTAVLGGQAIHDAGYWFVLTPVGLNTAIILGTALAFNNMTGRVYPHLTPVAKPNPHGTDDPWPSERLGPAPADVRAVLQDYDEIVNVSPEDLEALLHQAQVRAFNRRSGEITCGEIMSRDVLTVTEHTGLRAAWRQLLAHRIKALPVIAADRQLVGIITQTDFMRHAILSDDGRLKLGAGRRLFASVRNKKSPRHVRDIMTTRVQSALPETLIAKLVPPMADMGLHHMPVVDADNRLLGVVTQSDLIAALFRRRNVAENPA